jgi:hypothetical protein
MTWTDAGWGGSAKQPARAHRANARHHFTNRLARRPCLAHLPSRGRLPRHPSLGRLLRSPSGPVTIGRLARHRGAGWVHHPRLPDRPAGWHGQVPCRPRRTNHQLGSGQLRPLVPALPTAPALHDRQAGRTIRLQRHEDELRAARRQAVTRTFQQSYRRWRPMVERPLAWLGADGCRRASYRGFSATTCGGHSGSPRSTCVGC